MKKQVWLVIQWREVDTYELGGAFTTEAKARAACRDETYGYGPVPLDATLPDAPTEWPDFVYPLAEGA